MIEGIVPLKCHTVEKISSFFGRGWDKEGNIVHIFFFLYIYNMIGVKENLTMDSEKQKISAKERVLKKICPNCR